MFQVFGTKKCKDTQKALRFFKERNVDIQFIDLNVKGLSQGELNNVLQYYSIEDIIDTASKEYESRNFKYINHDKAKIALEFPLVLKTPIIRCNKKAKIGFDESKLKEWLVHK